MRYVLVPSIRHARFADLQPDERAITPEEIRRGGHRGRTVKAWRSYGYLDLPPTGPEGIEEWLESDSSRSQQIPTEAQFELDRLVALSNFH